MKNPVPFLKSWRNLLPDRWANFSPHLFPMFLNFGQKSWKNHLFCPPYYSPTLYINRKMIFHFFQRPFANYFWPKWDMNLRFSAKSPQFIPLWPYLIRFWLSFVNSLKNDFITMWSANLPPQNAENWEKSPYLTFSNFLRKRFKLWKIWCYFWNPEEISFQIDGLTFPRIFFRCS